MSQSHAEGLQHPKQEFQVERIAFFSDAVFAIAITLLIIEFHPPAVTKESTYESVVKELSHMRYKIFALLVSFGLIVSYWMRHHLLFKHIHNYNRSIVLANMWVLIPVIFFPFTTSFLYESFEGDASVIVIPFRLFLLNNVVSAATNYYLYYLVMKKYRGMAYPMDKRDSRSFEIKLIVLGCTFLIVMLLSYIDLETSLFGLIPAAAYNFYTRFIESNKKNKQTNAKQNDRTSDKGTS